MAKRTRKPTLMDQIMNEPIRLPGCPQIIVPRHWAWSWLKRMGYQEYPTTDTPFSNIQWMVCGRFARVVDEPFTDLTDPRIQRFLSQVEAHILGTTTEAVA